VAEKQTDRELGNLGFTRIHTQIAKGIAILLMVYHHLFVFPENLEYNYISVINMAGFDLQSILVNFGKICVGIFLFCSGIGLYYSLINIKSLKDMYKKVIVHGLKFMMNFWIFLLFMIPIGLYIHHFEFNARTIIQMITASYSEMQEWWFIRLYITLLFVAPPMIRLYQDIDVVKKIVPLGIVILVSIFHNIGIHLFTDESSILYAIINLFSNLNNYDCIVIFVVGIMCARFNIIESFQKVSGYKRWILCMFTVFVAVYIRIVFSNSPLSMVVDYAVVPLFVLPLVTVFYNTKIGTVLQFFAKHSTNIWFTHTFWHLYFGQKIVFLPKYSVLIYLWLLVLSLISSYVINLIYVPICNLLFNKMHKLSFNGYFFRKPKDKKA
jgi:hypothetical protein